MPIWEPIEGETPFDPSHLKDKSIKSRADLNIAEAKNILKAFEKYLLGKPSKTLAPFDLSWFEQLHHEMFYDVWNYAGNFRQENLNFGIPWQKIRTELYQLEHDIKFWEENQTFDTLETSVRIHYRAVLIHPFLNGNGRWSRLLGNIHLRQNNHSLVRWPEETIGTVSTIRNEYLSSVKSADAGNLSALIELHRRFSEVDR